MLKMFKDNWKMFLKFAGLAAFIVFAFYFARFVQDSNVVKDIVAGYGYIGIFLISVFGGFNLIVPVPSIAFLPLMLEAGLSFWPVLIIITIGSTVADSTSFFVGRMAKNISGPTNNKVIGELKKVEKKSSLAPLFATFFFISFAPVPAEVILVPMGYLEYSFIKILPIIFAGNLIFNFLFAVGISGLYNQVIHLI